MKRDFERLTKEQYDLAVIGGGVIGTGLARDAAMRGMKTVLLEKEDFGYGTTSRSTRLIHGGLRYLSHFDFKLVKQDLREREILLKIASHLVRPLPFLLPVTNSYQHFVMGTGMRMYDMLAKGKSVPSFRHVSRQETMSLEPKMQISGLKGAYEFYDAQVAFPERLCVENALSAEASGAVLINHAAVVGVEKSGNSVSALRVKDGLSRATARVSIKAVVSVAGHWSDDLLRMAIPGWEPKITTTLGIHLVTPKLSNRAVVLFARTDGRLIFVIPWQDYSLIGTTDTPYNGDKDHIAAEGAHVSYLLSEAKAAFPDLKAEDVFWTFAGLRALVGGSGKRVSNISRSHRIVDHQVSDSVEGLVSVLGGKMTAYRAIAEEAVDLVARKLGVSIPCSTAEAHLPGAPGNDPTQLQAMATEAGLDLSTAEHLNSVYGSRAAGVIKLAAGDENGRKKLCPHSKDIVAQLWHAIEEEECLTVTDFMLRRGTVGLCSCQGLDALETVGLEMGRKLGWSVGDFQQQVQDYRDFSGSYTQYRRAMFAPGEKTVER